MTNTMIVLRLVGIVAPAIAFICLATALLLAQSGETGSHGESGGTGTIEDPFQIEGDYNSHGCEVNEIEVSC